MMEFKRDVPRLLENHPYYPATTEEQQTTYGYAEVKWNPMEIFDFRSFF